MGLDIYIDKCRKPNVVDGKRIYEERVEMCYWRKFWGLLEVMNYTDDDDDVRMTKEDVEKMLDYATHNRDYWDGFEHVGQLCELLDQWDDLHEDGWTVYFYASW